MQVNFKWFALLCFVLMGQVAMASGTRGGGAGGSGAGSERDAIGGSGRGLIERNTERNSAENTKACSDGMVWNKRASACVQTCKKGERYSIKKAKCVKKMKKKKKNK